MATRKYPLVMLLPLRMWRHIVDFWRGRKTLVSAFWGVGVFGLLLLVVSIFLLMTHINGAEQLLFVIPIYVLYALKAIWACSANAKNNMWGDLTKTGILLLIFLCVFSVVRPGFSRFPVY